MPYPILALLVWEKQRAWQQAEGHTQKEAPGRGAGAAEAEEGHMKTEGQHFPGIREGPGEEAVS